jgi:hypothetical protein
MKFELTGETKVVLGITLNRIRALLSFGIVNKGELGGWVEKKENVSNVGNARVFGNADILWFSKVGSQFGTLTAFRAADGVVVTRGCFTGTLDAFRKAVIATHGTSLYAHGYLGLANYIEWHFAELHKPAAKQ